MAKYDPLCNHLKTQNKTEILMTFEEIEDVLRSKLPPSAHKHSAWWAKGEAGQHVQKRAWLDAGYIIENVDQFRQRVTFKRSR